MNFANEARKELFVRNAADLESHEKVLFGKLEAARADLKSVYVQLFDYKKHSVKRGRISTEFYKIREYTN